MTAVTVPTIERHASQLLDLLVDCGPLTAVECCDKLGWSRGRFDAAIRHARAHLCPALGIAIPAATPDSEWRYEATTEWEPVEAGASYTLGQVESRLLGVHRDVQIVLPKLKRGTKEWRRANFLHKHLAHLVGTLREINDGEG